MFEDSLLESCGHLESHRGWATVASAVVECCFISILILFPLAFTDALPQQQLVTYLLTAPPPPLPPPPPPGPGTAAKAARAAAVSVVDSASGKIHAPGYIPVAIAKIHDNPEDFAGAGVPGGVPGGVIGGIPGGVVGGVI